MNRSRRRRRRAPVAAAALSTAALALLGAQPRDARAQSAPPAPAERAARGGETSSGPDLGPESSALALLREAERDADQPVASNVAEAAAADGTSLPAAGLDPAFAARLQLPSLAVRISPRLARALAMHRADARARRAMVSWLRHAERYRARIEVILASEGVPTELVWVAAAESGFDPGDTSSAGAVGLWQLMPDAARSYGLRVDAWVDERRDPDRATRAAARMLRDLRARFGAWDLALAAYNMGYNALLRAIRKYNTNDFDALAGVEAGLPYETVHYVPRILAAAVVARNAALFNLSGAPYDAVVAWDEAPLDRSVPLEPLATALGVPLASLRALNPALLRARTPPASPARPFVLHVPAGARARAAAAAQRLGAPPARLVRARHGETLDEIAERYGATREQVLALSGLARDHRVAPGTELFVPDREPASVTPRERPLVAIDPPAQGAPAGRRRVFYRVGTGDELAQVARALGVRREELLAWNALDARARLQSGMWLQAYVAGDAPEARVWGEAEVDLVRRGSEEFHDRHVATDGRVRVRVVVRAGDTMESLATRYGLTVGSLARINRRSRNAQLAPGELVVVYAEPERLDGGELVPPVDEAPSSGASSTTAPSANAADAR